MSRIAIAILIALAIATTQHSVAIAQLYGNRLTSKDGKWLLPVASLHLTSTESDHINRRSVQAWDITAPKGTPIFPIEAGVVEYAGCNNSGGYGCWTLIRHDSGVKTIMGHMVSGSITVRAGQRVSQWDVVGQVGWTGMTSFGPHVHLEIHKATGGRYNVSDFWDISKMHYQKLGNAQSSEIITEIGVAGNQSTQQPTHQSINRLMTLLQVVAQTPANQVGSVVFVVTMLIGFLMWVGGMWIRIVIVSAGSAMVGAAVIIALLMPLTPVAANQQSAVVGGGDKAWEWAYPIIQRNEGWSCTEDGAHTMGGVTQGTYNRWRRLHGMGTADVCGNLTREQAKTIYYELFWLGSGSDRLPAAMGLAVTDHYIVTGKVAYLVAQCGADIECFHKARIVDFQSKSNCYLYCRAWINRVNNVRKITQSFQ